MSNEVRPTDLVTRLRHGGQPDLADMAAGLQDALESIFALMDEGWLVRDISDDGSAGWAMRQLGPIQKLAKARFALAKAKGEQT